MSGQQRWGHGLAGPAQRHPLVWSLGVAVAGGLTVGFAIGWRWSR